MSESNSNWRLEHAVLGGAPGAVADCMYGQLSSHRNCEAILADKNETSATRSFWFNNDEKNIKK